MSNKAINYVLEHSKTKGSARVLMIVIADMANDDGSCWPGKAKLEDKVNVQERQLIVLIQDCERMNELRVITRDSKDGDNESNIYLIIGLASAAMIARARPVRAKYVRKSKPKPKGGVADNTTHGGVADNSRGGVADNTPVVLQTTVGGVLQTTPKPLVEPLVEPSDKPNTVGANAPTDGAGKKPRKKKQPELKPRSECEPEPLYEAVERHIFGISNPASSDPYAWQTPTGFIALWLMGRLGKFKDAQFGFISRAAEPEHVETFATWYRKQYNKASLPRDVVKFVSHWREWASARADVAKRQSVVSTPHEGAKPENTQEARDRVARMRAAAERAAARTRSQGVKPQ